MQSGPFGTRTAYARIRSSPCNIFVTGVYMAHCTRKAKPFFSDVLKQLDDLLSHVSQHDCIVLLGDLNCNLARNQQHLTGKWCVHKYSSKEGKDMLALMQRYKLSTVSTFFQPKRGKTNITYLPKDPLYKPSQIDYVLMSSRWATSVKDSKVKWGVSCQRWSC